MRRQSRRTRCATRVADAPGNEVLDCTPRLSLEGDGSYAELVKVLEGRPERDVPLRARWDRAAQALVAHRDVLEARPRPGERGGGEWHDFLLSLDDGELAEIESRGHEARWPERAPPSLLALVTAARVACDVPALLPDAGDAAPRATRRRETPRKRAQVEAFAALVRPLTAYATRFVDVGSGHGHLTRGIAEQNDVPVVGLERDVQLASRARALPSTRSPTFAVTDVVRDGLPLEPGDCVVGLHACGELGDLLVTRVASMAGARASLALVGCCLQKRRSGERVSLCAPAALERALALPKPLLGLSNLTARDEGVEATRVENLAARERRIALHRLLAEAGVPLGVGRELEGLNRRVAHHALADLVARAFVLRGLTPPSADRIAKAAAWAAGEHARVRRLGLPRGLLARVLEVFVLLDRAVYLEQHGFEVAIGSLFAARVSPRNLALVASSS